MNDLAATAMSWTTGGKSFSLTFILLSQVLPPHEMRAGVSLLERGDSKWWGIEELHQSEKGSGCGKSALEANKEKNNFTLCCGDVTGWDMERWSSEEVNYDLNQLKVNEKKNHNFTSLSAILPSTTSAGQSSPPSATDLSISPLRGSRFSVSDSYCRNKPVSLGAE